MPKSVAKNKSTPPAKPVKKVESPVLPPSAVYPNHYKNFVREVESLFGVKEHELKEECHTLCVIAIKLGEHYSQQLLKTLAYYKSLKRR